MGKFWLPLLLLGLVVLAKGSSDETENNEIGDDYTTKGKSIQEGDYDPSFLEDIIGEDYFDDVAKTESSVKKSVSSESQESLTIKKKAPCHGCAHDVNAEDNKISEIANFAFNTYTTGSVGDGDAAQTFVRTVKAQTQVVAGQKYILQVEAGYLNCSQAVFKSNPELCVLDETKETFLCDFEVVEKSWLNSKDVVRSECRVEGQVSDDDVVTEAEASYDDAEETTTSYPLEFSRKKRDVAATSGHEVFGKLRKANESKEELLEIAKFAIEQLDEIDADDEARFALEVLKAKKQTVSGWLYHLKVRVGQTSCKEGQDKTIQDCKDKLEMPLYICDVKVLFQPWQEMSKKVTESSCEPDKMKRISKKLARKLFPEEKSKKKYKVKKNDIVKDKAVGGPTEVDLDAPEIQRLVSFAMTRVDAQSNALHAQKLVSVVRAERQVVNGILTKLTIETGYTNCRKSQDLDSSKCELNEDREHQFCEIHVWEKPWADFKEITKSECGKREQILKRSKRALIGGGTHDYDAHKITMFNSFLTKYNKKYEDPEEFKYRLGVFHDNMKKVKLLQDNEQGTATYGATIFADLTEEEFSERHLGLRPDLKIRGKVKKAKIPEIGKLPEEFDWRKYSAVTPVKNQGSCGSCWAFSVTGNIEGLYARQHGKLVSFSEQELVDCDTLDSGCGGGLPENAYKAIQKLGGLEAENDYPYDGKNEKCHFKQGLAAAKVTGFVEVPQNETEMAAFLVKNGPISIGINANAMQFYFGGVSHPWKYLCSPKQLDHGVLVVGYGVHTTSIRHKVMPYWLVKNSWGPHWGEQGYYRVYRGDGTCGVNQMATSATIE